MVKTTEEFSVEELENKKIEFLKVWKKYDWTELL
jgi:hypothetical protein